MAGSDIRPSELAQHVYEMWNRADRQAVADFFAPDSVFETSGVFPGFAPTYRGPEGLLRFYDQMLEAWDELSLEPVHFTDLLGADG